MPAARLLESAMRRLPGVNDAPAQMRREPTRWFHSAIDENGVARVCGRGATEAKAAATASQGRVPSVWRMIAPGGLECSAQPFW
jgi:hypothetical protein